VSLITLNPDNPQPRQIRKIVEKLRRGAIICYPTDTVYGIGCDIYNQKAVKRIFQIKQRPKNKPFSFMCCSLKNVSTYCHISNMAYRLMKKHLPGPYTFILQGEKIVPKIMVTKQKTVGIRVPDNQVSLAIVSELGNPILNTSAIIDSGDEPLVEGYEIEEKFGKLVDCVIDGGPVYPSPSSVISLTEKYPEIIRYGKGDVSQFE
jgi:tRNA threonylcarbamoyl adenosine modification protein (Sua5/YciO/YrdC/YwlC family)